MKQNMQKDVPSIIQFPAVPIAIGIAD